MYRIIIGEISEKRKSEWNNGDVSVNKVLENKLFEKDCTIDTLSTAAKTFRDEVQLDWGTFAWKAFKSEIKRFFQKKGIPKKELESFDPFKEYGVVYIDD